MLFRLLAFFRAVSPELAWRVGFGIGAFVAVLPLRDVRRAREHLARAFPERDAAWVRATARRSFGAIAAGVLLGLACLHRERLRLRRGIRCPDRAALCELLRASHRGQGTVIWTGHYGAWELFALLAGSILPLTAIGRRLRVRWIDELVRSVRMHGGAEVVYQEEDPRGLMREIGRAHV